MLLFFYGPETFRPGAKIQTLKERFLAKNPTASGLLEFDCSEGCALAAIVQDLGAQNLFAPKKLVVLTNVFATTKADEQKVLREALEKRSGDDVVILWEQSLPRKNNAFFKWLLKTADQTQTCEELSGARLAAWVGQHVKTLAPETTIERAAVEQLILFVGTDLHRMNAELQKLVNYAAGQPITQADVDHLVAAQVDADIFATIDAVAAGDTPRALRLLRDHSTKGDDPFYVFSMYVYQLRTLLTVGSFYWAGQQDRYAIAKQAKLHPFVVQKSLAALQRLPQERLLAAYATLQAYDQDVKTGRRDMQTVLDLFVMQV